MASFDAHKLCAPLSDSSPSGEDLSYDAAYLELMREAAGKPESVMGESRIEAVEPNWRTVKEGALSLLERTRDLRLFALLTAAAVATEGFEGLRESLKALGGAIEKLWDSVYPTLDPDDGNDPMERVNLLSGLAAPPGSDGDTLRVIEKIRGVALTNSRQVGRFTFRQILVSKGELPAVGEEPVVEGTLIDAAFEDTVAEELQGTEAALAGCVEATQGIDRAITSKVGAGAGPNLSALRGALEEVRKEVQRALAKRGYGPEPSDAQDQRGGGSAQGALSGEIRSNGDVLMALDKICRYYERIEPASPVPLLLKRAQRLVGKSFIDIVKDLTPDSISHLEGITGVELKTEE